MSDDLVTGDFRWVTGGGSPERVETWTGDRWVPVAVSPSAMSKTWIGPVSLDTDADLDNPDKRGDMLEALTKAAQDISPNLRRKLIKELEDAQAARPAGPYEYDTGWAHGYAQCLDKIKEFLEEH